MDQIYHVLNRGVDKKQIFLDKQDYLRFIHDLFEFNDKNWTNNNFHSFHYSTKIKNSNSFQHKSRELLVDILAFVIMPNHYHLILSPRLENGITIFMRKLNMGYAKYFNQKYNRSGTLFEGRYKSIPIEKESHFIHLPYYIHLNPLDLIAPEWRERKIKNFKEVINFLENYRWSSHLDYLGKHNFPSVINKEPLLEFFGSEKEYEKLFYEWLKDLDLSDIQSCILE